MHCFHHMKTQLGHYKTQAYKELKARPIFCNTPALVMDMAGGYYTYYKSYVIWASLFKWEKLYFLFVSSLCNYA